MARSTTLLKRYGTKRKYLIPGTLLLVLAIILFQLELVSDWMGWNGLDADVDVNPVIEHNGNVEELPNGLEEKGGLEEDGETRSRKGAEEEGEGDGGEGVGKPIGQVKGMELGKGGLEEEDGDEEEEKEEGGDHWTEKTRGVENSIVGIVHLKGGLEFTDAERERK